MVLDSIMGCVVFWQRDITVNYFYTRDLKMKISFLTFSEHNEIIDIFAHMEDKLIKANKHCADTMLGSLGIQFTKLEEGLIEATMPVDHRTHQPYGLLHGGASAALAESLGSYGSHLLVEDIGGICVGVELNINHIKGKRHGFVTGIAKIIHRGRSLHIWNIEIVDEENALIATSRLTVMVKQKKD